MVQKEKLQKENVTKFVDKDESSVDLSSFVKQIAAIVSSVCIEENSFADLCFDIISDIFFRLPYDDLIRCKSVCKTWYKFIRDDFTKLQMIKALRQPRCLILEPRVDYGRPRNSLFLIDRDECREIPLKQQELKFGNNIAGSCNGLLCIGSCLRDKTIIYNPITRESMELPKMSPKNFEKLETIYGFGFDHITKKYKVVFVYRFIDIDYYGAKKAPVTMGEIITVGGSWRKLKFPYEVQFECEPETVFLDGSFHWKIDKDRPTGSEARILALDISTEKFHTYSFPPALELPDYYSLRLINFAGSLAFVDTKIRRNESYEIWRIFDPKTNYRRIYRYTCKPLGAVGWWNRWKVLNVASNGCVLYQATVLPGWREEYQGIGEHDQLALYNPEKEKSVILDVCGIPPYFQFHTSFLTPTLLSPKDIKCSLKQAIDEEREKGRAREKSRSRSRSSSRSVSPSVDIEWFYRKGKAEMRRRRRKHIERRVFLGQEKEYEQKSGRNNV